MRLLLSFLTTYIASSPAWSQSAPGAPAPFYVQFVPIAFMLVVLYFLMIRPQAKKQKAHQEFLSSLKRGDEVVTAAGILGTVEGLTEQFITLEIAPNVRIKVLRSQVASNVATATEVKAQGTR